MKMKKRILSMILTLAMVVGMLPPLALPVRAAEEIPTFSVGSGDAKYSTSTGRPTQLKGQLSVNLYYGGDTIPGEPRFRSNQTYSDGYLHYDNTFTKGGSNNFAVDEVLLDSVFQGNFVIGSNLNLSFIGLGYISATSGLFDANGVEEHFTEDFKTALEAYGTSMISDVLAAKNLPDANPENYEIVWYVVKYQRLSTRWNLDGIVREKNKYSVAYDGNGNTSGSAPDSQVNMTYSEAQNYLVKDETSTDDDGKDTSLKREGYTFAGWNTKADGSGTFFEAKKYADLTKVTDNEGNPVTAITLYAQWSKNRSVKWYDGDGNIIHMDSELSSGSSVTYNGAVPTKTSTASVEYIFDGWSDVAGGAKKYDMYPTVTVKSNDNQNKYYAHFAEQTRTYTVTWVNDIVLETDSGIAYNGTAAYNGAPPTRGSTATKAYTFVGWATEEGGAKAHDPGVEITVTGDTTLYAVFSETDIYTVTWHSEDGSSVLATKAVLDGDATALTQSAPAKEGYTHSGWATEKNGAKVHEGDATVTVTGDLDLYARYEKNIYTITWKNGDAKLGTTQVEHGETPVYGGAEPQKTPSTERVYTFAGWEDVASQTRYPLGTLPEATGNVTYAAYFTDSARPYTVTWKNWDGTVLRTEQVNYGEIPSYGSAPTRAATSTHTYTFKGWTPSVSAVTGDVIYTADYNEIDKLFTATVKVWKNPVVDANGAIDAEHSTPADIGSPLTAYNVIYLRKLNTEEVTALTKSDTGVYTAQLPHGEYQVVIADGEGGYDELTKERIRLPAEHSDEDPDTTTSDLLFYSVTYMLDGGRINSSSDPIVKYDQRRTHVQVITQTPKRDGYVFAGWKLDDTDRILQAEQAITDISLGLIRSHTLTAQWIRAEDKVVVNVTIRHHDSAKQGINPEYKNGTLNIDLTHREKVTNPGDYYEKVGYSKKFSNGSWYSDSTTTTEKEGDVVKTCTTTLISIYSADGLPSNWEYSANVTMEDYWRVEGPKITETEDGNGNTTYTIDVTLQYNPDLFNLNYEVVIDDSVPDDLVPTAVDLKVLSYDAVTPGNWDFISRHQQGATMDETFTASDRTETGSYPVPVHKTNDTNYYYRVAVAGFTLPDGTELSASDDTGDGKVKLVDYKSDATGSTATYSYADGAYTAVVEIENGTTQGGVPAVYGSSDGNGGYTQTGSVTVTVYAHPKTVTFDPNGGTLNGTSEPSAVSNQFRIPVLANYRPVPPTAKHVFLGWYLTDGAGNMTDEAAVTGTPISGDVTLKAKWKDPLTVSGKLDITLPNTVHPDDRPTSVKLSLVRTSPTGVVETTQIKEIDVPTSAWSGNTASVTYTFDPVVQTGTYRVHVTAPDYNVTFHNDAGNNENFVYDHDGNDRAAVDIEMDFTPQPVDLTWEVSYGEMGEAVLPMGVGIEVKYANEAREVLAPDAWPKFVLQSGPRTTTLPKDDADRKVSDSFEVWQNHPQGYPYDYALEVVKWTDKDGVEHVFDDTAPFTISYAPRIAWYENGNQVITGKIPSNLGITVAPKTYTITYVLNSGADPVTGWVHAPRNHTWSKETTGIPTDLTRAGYKFLGWDCDVDGAYAAGTVSADTAQNVTLTAQWLKLKPVTFRVINGTFTGGGDPTSRTVYVVPDAISTSVAPGVEPNTYYEGGSWAPELPVDDVFVGTDAVTYTYTFQRQNTTVNYGSYVTNDYLPQAASKDLLRGDYIRVNPNGGIWNASSDIRDVRMTDDSGILILPDPTRNQHIFAGWYAENMNDITTHDDGTVSTQFTAIWLQDSEPCDGVPDMYQKKLTFRVENGHWADGTDTEKVIYVDLKDGSGKYSTVGTAQIPGDTIAAISNATPKAGFIADGAFWSPSLPAGYVVSGTEDRIYTFRHYIKITFADADHDMVEDEMHLLPGTVVTVDPNGGTLSGSNEAITVAVTGSGHLIPPDNPNHTFKGWKLTDGTAPVSHVFTAQWELVSYEIVWKNDDGTVLETDEAVPYGTLPTYDGEEPTKAADAQYAYIFSGWTPKVEKADGDAEYTATYSSTINKYTVTWKNGDTVLGTVLIPYGQKPVYSGATPTKKADTQYTYAFNGWLKEGTGEPIAPGGLPDVTGDVTYVASFGNTTNQYTVTWVDGNGTTLKTEQVEYGTRPEYVGETPIKTATAQYTYTFNGWLKEGTGEPIAIDDLPAVTGNVTYVAAFADTINQYAVQWLKEDGTEISSVTLYYGDYPVAPAAPAKQSTAQYTYTFKGWTNTGGTTYLIGNIPMVTGNATYKATYTETVNKYTVTWRNYNETVMESDEDVPYGTVPSFDSEAKLTTDDANYHYTFRGWWVDSNGDGVQDAGEPFYPKNTALPGIVGHVTYKAVYDTTPKARSVTINVWLNATENGDGSFSGDRADIDTVTNGQRANLYLVPKGSEEDHTKYIKALWNGTEKIYSASLLPGQYLIYAGDTAETAESEATQIVDVVNTNVTVNTLYNSVTYNAGDGAFSDDADSHTTYYKSGFGPIYVPKDIPTLSGKVFTHWHDESSNVFNASTDGVTITLTDSIIRGYTLTAHWAEAKPITVKVNINPKSGDNTDPALSGKTLNLQLASSATQGGTYIGIHGTNKEAAYSAWTHNGDGTYTYAATYPNQRGDHYYQATALLAGYERTGDIDVSPDGKTVTINLKYDPDGFDLNFVVEMDATGLDPALVPNSVDVQIVFFERTDKNGNGRWKTLSNTQNKPIEVSLSRIGDSNTWRGTGTYHVWSKYTSGNAAGELYLYRIAVNDFDLGTNRGALAATAPATGADAFKVYTSVAGTYHPVGAYTATVTVLDQVNNCPHGTAGGLLGSHDSNGTQHGTITATITANPYDVVLKRNDGTDATVETIENRFLIPDLTSYKPTRTGYTFAGWWTKDGTANGDWGAQIVAKDTVIKDLIPDAPAGSTLNLYARWNKDLTVTGDVTVSNLYQGDIIYPKDRPAGITVELRNAATDAVLYSQAVLLTDPGATEEEKAAAQFRTGTYTFAGIPDNGTEYRIYVAVPNFDQKYRNETVAPSAAFSESLYAVVDQDGDDKAKVDVSLTFNPHTFDLEYTVDATEVGEGFRPTAAGIVVYSGIGTENPENWNIIAQQKQGGTVEAHEIGIAPNGIAQADAHSRGIWHKFPVWRRSSSGDLYEYAIRLWTVTHDGHEHDQDDMNGAPYTVTYAPSRAWFDGEDGQESTGIRLTSPDSTNPHGLVAYITPKSYTVTYELGQSGTVTGAGITTEDGDTAKGTFRWSYGIGEGNLPTATAASGATFGGWYTKDGSGNWGADEVTFIDANTMEDVTLYARWKYDVTWKNGSESTTDKVLEGTKPVYSGATPTKVATAQYTYTFNGWQHNGMGTVYTAETLPVVTGNVTYEVSFSNNTNRYTVTWVDENGTTELEKDENVAYGEMPRYDGAAPTKAATPQYTYTFAGWTPGISSVTGDVTYKATYTETVNKYTVTWKNENGTTLKTEQVEYGTKPVYTGATPTKAATAQYTYTFKGWEPSIADDTKVTGDVTYTATYSGTVNEYTVTWVDGNGDTLKTDTLAYGATPSYTGATPTKMATAQYNYQFLERWSPEVKQVTGNATYTAQFLGIQRTYPVTWKNEDGTVLETDSGVPYGTTPKYDGATPTKAATDEHTYTFAGWTPAVGAITGETVYTATYSETVNKYTVTWKNENGTILKTEQVEYGTKPVYSGATPTKEATAQYTYTFKGWDPSITDDTKVTGDVTYTAQFDSTVNGYTVIWKDADGTVLETDGNVPYNTTPSYDNGGGTVENLTQGKTDASNGQYTYTWAGWLPTVSAVTGDAIYTASYTRTTNKYTVKWVDENGSELLSRELEYGATPVYTEAEPTKTGDAQYGYTFTGWWVDRNSDGIVDAGETYAKDATLPKVNTNLTYKATFEQFTNSYTVIWKNENGAVLETDNNVHYGTLPSYNGETPTKAATAECTYTFDKWSPEVSAVTGDVTYTATYTATKQSYTIKWVDENGAELKTEVVEYGKTPTAPADPTKTATAQYTYTFGGWSPEVKAVTGEATYMATYHATVKKYTVTWKNENGDVLETDTEVAYGTTPEFNKATPTKAATAQYTYTFKGWSPSTSDVTGDVTYTAVYNQTLNSYTVVWKNGDTVLETDENIPYGATPKYDGALPTKEADAQYTYTWAGWTPAISAVTGNVTYMAKFDSTVKEYDVVWKNDDGTVLETDSKVPYGTTPSYDGATPTKAATAEYTYTFKEWNPTVESVSGTAVYTATYTATKNTYTVKWMVNGELKETDTVEYGKKPEYNGTAPSKTPTAEHTFTFAGWSPAIADNTVVTGDVTYTAVFIGTGNTYTVIWKNEGVDTPLETDENVPYGSIPTYNGETPVKAGDIRYSYRHVGWTPAITAVEGNKTYTAVFEQVVNKYPITWVDGNGNVLKTEQVEYGTKPVYTGATPAKAADAQYTYTFKGWDPSITDDTKVTGPATYTAQFDSTLNTYIITWRNDDGSVIDTTTVAYGGMPVHADPAKDSTARYHYSFRGWNPAVSAVTGAAAYTAQFDSIEREYTITWQDDDGTTIDTTQVKYGDMPNHASPSKAATAQYTYTFNKWLPALASVTGDATYTASYSESVNKYTVTWKNEGVDTPLETDENVPYGDTPEYNSGTPTKAATNEYTYTFKGWDKAISDVTGDVTYTAQYTETPRLYTVTWKNHDGTVLETKKVTYNAPVPVYDGVTPVKASTAEFTYAHTGWTPAETNITEDTVLTAVFAESARKYTVTWVDDDGSSLGSAEVEYGTTPSRATPTKDANDEYTYTFAGWTPTVVSVVGNATYKATYSAAKKSYTITWQNDDGSGIDTTTVEYGVLPTHAAPTKAATAEYTYTFAGWTPAVVSVTGEATYKATFTETKNKHPISWVDGNGNTLKTEEVEYGTTPSYTGTTPTKTATAQHTYAFNGNWNPTVTSVTGPATYTAQFDSTVNKYTVTWRDDNGGMIDTTEVEYGTVPTHADPVKVSTSRYDFTFRGWKDEHGTLHTGTLPAVTGNAEYTADFSSTARLYTVVWKDEDGTVLETDTDVGYEAMPSYDDEIPTKAADAQYTYTFAGWSPTLVKVTGNTEYTATYSTTVNEYLITVSVTNGTASPAGSVSVPYGSDQMITFVPNDGYALSSVTVNGVPASLTGNTYTFTNVTANQSIAVVYAENSGTGGGIGGGGGGTGGGGSGGTVILTKVDGTDNTTTLSNVEFSLYRSDTRTRIGTYVTDANGVITVSGLTAGDYYWVETRSKEGYLLDSSEKAFALREGQTNRMTVMNRRSAVPDSFSREHYAYIIGGGDGLVRPEATITRAEVATIFFRLLDDTTRNRYYTEENSFGDVEEGMWFNTAVSTMAAMGIINGYPNGNFGPTDHITRAEFAAIASRFERDGDVRDASFEDIYEHWAKKEINIAANNGWVLGYTDGTFRPDQSITRAEAMTMVNRVLQRTPENPDDLLPGMVEWEDNRDTRKWYYLAVQEASNSHDYVKRASGYEKWTHLRETRDWASLER